MTHSQSAGLTSIIVPTRNQATLLEQLAASLEKTRREHRIELLIVDNGSDDPATLAWLARAPERLSTSGFESVKVLKDPSPFNYSALNNRAAREAQGEFLCLLNNDIEAIEDNDWLGALLVEAQRKDVGCVGAKLLYPSGLVQHAGVMLGMGRVAGHPFKGLPQSDPGPDGWLTRVQRVSAVTGACLLIRRTVFEELGGLEEALAVCWNDVDLCLRADAAGYHCVWTPEAVLYHHESASRKRRRSSAAHRRRHQREVKFMHKRWGASLAQDRFLDHLPEALRAGQPQPRSLRQHLNRWTRIGGKP